MTNSRNRLGDPKPNTEPLSASKKVDDISRHESKHDTNPKNDPAHDPKLDPKNDPKPKPEEGIKPEPNPKKH